MYLFERMSKPRSKRSVRGDDYSRSAVAVMCCNSRRLVLLHLHRGMAFWLAWIDGLV